MNVITLVGRAGRDPEVRYFESGTMVANLSLAVNGRGRDAEAEWFNLEIWGKQAQVAADYVRKGSLIGVYGSVKTEKWTDRTTGEEKRKTVVNVDRLQLLGSKRDNEGQASSAPPADQAPAAAAPVGSGPATAAAPPAWNSRPVDNTGFDEEEVPF